MALLAAATGLTQGSISEPTSGHALIIIVQALVYLAGAIALLRWVYLANANTHTMGAQNMMSPALAAGCYFIPLANLVMPFQSMRDIWRASTEPRDWESVRAPALIGWWWSFWLLYLVASAITLALDSEGASQETAHTAVVITAISDLLLVPASLLLAKIIGEITAMQGGAAIRETFA